MSSCARSLIAIDHLMISQASPEDAIRSFERLGFTLRGFRSLAPMGGGATGGRGGSNIIMFRAADAGAANYLELAYLDPATGSEQMKQILTPPTGVAMIVHSAEDATRLHREWTEAGLELAPMLHLDMPAIGDAKAQSVQIVIPLPGTQPIYCNAVQLSSLADYQIAALQSHPNGALRFTALSLVTDDVTDNLKSFLHKVYGGDPAKPPTAPGSVAIRVMAADAFTKSLPAGLPAISRPLPAVAMITILVESLHTARRVLGANGVAVFEGDGRLYVSPLDATGVVLELTE